MGCSASKPEDGEGVEAGHGPRPIMRRRIEDMRRRRHVRTRKDSIVSTTELLGHREDPDGGADFSEDSPDRSTFPSLPECDDGAGGSSEEDKTTVAKKDEEPVHEEKKEEGEVEKEEEKEPEHATAAAVVANEEKEGERKKEEEEGKKVEVDEKEEERKGEEGEEEGKKVEVDEREEERKGEEEEEEEEEEPPRSPSFRFYVPHDSDSYSDDSVKAPWLKKKEANIDEDKENKTSHASKAGEENSHAMKHKKENSNETDDGAESSSTSTGESEFKAPKKGKKRRLRGLTKAPSRVYKVLGIRSCYSHIDASDAAAASRRTQRLLSEEVH